MGFVKRTIMAIQCDSCGLCYVPEHRAKFLTFGALTKEYVGNAAINTAWVRIAPKGVPERWLCPECVREKRK